jgi:hypothetical protein
MRQLAYILLLLSATLIIHALVITWLSRRARDWAPLFSGRPLGAAWRMVQIASWLILAHLAEITVWALSYTRLGVVSDPETAVYFSLVTYTTVGYGDVVPTEHWRLLAGVEALTGILMCGWSAAFFFSVVSQRRTHQADGGDSRPA